MTMPLSEAKLAEPRSLRDALEILAGDPSMTPIAGCTDVFVGLRLGTIASRRFLNLWGLGALRGIAKMNGGLRIGALSTYRELSGSPLVRKSIPMLVTAATQVGGAQIQNRGTLGGNIANGSPASDVLPILAALDATLVLSSVRGTRRVPVTEFYVGYRKSVMEKQELIIAVEVPNVRGQQWFRKVGTRQAQAISKLVMAGVRSNPPRLAMGSVAPTVLRLRNTEAQLARGASVDEAKMCLLEEIAPIDDIRSTRAYRQKVATNLLAKFWKDTAASQM